MTESQAFDVMAVKEVLACSELIMSPNAQECRFNFDTEGVKISMWVSWENGLNVIIEICAMGNRIARNEFWGLTSYTYSTENRTVIFYSPQNTEDSAHSQKRYLAVSSLGAIVSVAR